MTSYKPATPRPPAPWQHKPEPELHREIRAYLEFIEEARKEVVVTLTYEAICARADAIQATNPETPGPGKYEGNDDRVLAEMLEEATGLGWIDQEYGSVDETGCWHGLLGRFIVEEDSQGFFCYLDAGDEESARETFDRIVAAHEEDGA